MKKHLNKLLAAVLSLLLVISIIPAMTFAVSAISYSDYKTKYTSFINDSRWKEGASYGENQGPKSATTWNTGAKSCCAYAVDFIYYVYGATGWGSMYTSVSDIKTGDTVWTGSHWFVVLERNGDSLYTAEGNNNGKVAIVRNDHYRMYNGKLQSNFNTGYSNSKWSDNSFSYGYHYDISYSSSEPHIHSYTTFAYVGESHPHYKYYKCSCGDIKMSDETTVVDDCPLCKPVTLIDYSAKFELVANSKVEHKSPYGSSETTKTYSKGDIITVVGYTYNDYGNLWYKTTAGGYIYYEYLKLDTMIKYLPPSNYVEATVKVKGASKWVKSSPAASGEYLTEYKKDNTIQITHYLYNSAGNLWYETSEGDGHYVFYSYLEVQSASDWMPSSYIEGTVEIEKDNTPVRDIIQGEGSTVVEKLNKGDTKQVIGYAYNRYGNLWYVLGEDRVVFYDCCKNIGNSELLSNYIGQEMIVSKETKLYAGNYWGTVTDTTVSAGTKVNVVAYVINKYGNKYYEIEGEKYIPEGYLIPYNYTVSFDSNGGSGTMAGLNVVYEEVFTLPECSFNKSGYEFKGWNAQRKCDGKWYVQNKGWNSEADIIANNYAKNIYADKWEGYLNNSWANNIIEANEFTLYALWEPVSHSHNYNVAITPPTCTNRGYTTYTCASCGDTYIDNYTNTIPHTPSDWITDTPAQPGVAGSKHKECTICHTVLETETIPAPEIIDENAPQIVIDSKKATAGKTVEVKVALKNNPGVASLKLKVAYDSDLTLTGIKYNGEIGGNAQQPQTLLSPVVLNWFNGETNSTGDFVFATLTFKVNDNATVGAKNITLTYNPKDVYNIAEKDIEFAVVSGGIEVNAYTPGDINDDGEVNNKDLTRLFQYLSEWDVTVNEAALDVNGDGDINNKDLTRLFQYLSEWDVVIY